MFIFFGYFWISLFSLSSLLAQKKTKKKSKQKGKKGKVDGKIQKKKIEIKYRAK